jgi:hypothetical protein
MSVFGKFISDGITGEREIRRCFSNGTPFSEKLFAMVLLVKGKSGAVFQTSPRFRKIYSRWYNY